MSLGLVDGVLKYMEESLGRMGGNGGIGTRRMDNRERMAKITKEMGSWIVWRLRLPGMGGTRRLMSPSIEQSNRSYPVSELCRLCG